MTINLAWQSGETQFEVEPAFEMYGYKFHVYQYPDLDGDELWFVVEHTTGKSVDDYYETKEDAIYFAKSRLTSLGEEAVRRGIERWPKINQIEFL